VLSLGKAAQQRDPPTTIQSPKTFLFDDSPPTVNKTDVGVAVRPQPRIAWSDVGVGTRGVVCVWRNLPDHVLRIAVIFSVLLVTIDFLRYGVVLGRGVIALNGKPEPIKWRVCEYTASGRFLVCRAARTVLR
jgi:hypothetical protein